VIGKSARRTASAAEDVQTVLGEHHDAVAAEAWLRDEWTDQARDTTSSTISPAVCFEVGRLVAEAHHRQEESAELWTDAWDELRKPKRLRWLTGR
jgi:CHAD domain-containing protein